MEAQSWPVGEAKMAVAALNLSMAERSKEEKILGWG
jgi:hypothetical protein